ncbi:MAG: NifB/NifX family molybdenum-iron cluster-binding protein [Candidatus Methylomirabilia bacterium]
MKIAFPVQDDIGIDSIVFNHFGSAPVFVIVDQKANTVASVANRDQQHAHGACNPMRALDNQQVDAVVVGGIGAGALAGLNRMGIKVHRSLAATVRENLALFGSGGLTVIGAQGTCAGHGADGGCAHEQAADGNGS